MNPEEANQLRRDLDDAVAEVVTATMNGRPHAPRPLSWTLGNRLSREGWGTELTGQAGRGDYTEHEVPGLVQDWADFLGLQPAEDPMPGSTEAVGRFPLGRVAVWGVSDSAAWEAEIERCQQPIQAVRATTADTNADTDQDHDEDHDEDGDER